MNRRETISTFVKAAEHVDHDLADMLLDSFHQLSNLLTSEKTSIKHKLLTLKQLNSYIQRKTNDLEFAYNDTSHLSLRKLRNELAHSKNRRDFDLTSYYPELWKAIERLGNRLGPYQIENLLAYTLRIPNIQAAQDGATSNKIVQLYKPYFRKLDEESQRDLFVVLLLRLFTDNESLNLLEKRE